MIQNKKHAERVIGAEVKSGLAVGGERKLAVGFSSSVGALEIGIKRISEQRLESLSRKLY